VRADQRSAEALAWRGWYSTASWRALRAAQLARKPLCERCEANGLVVAATVANHKIPHKGDRKLFFNSANLESVCKDCHDGPIQREERLGYSPAVGPDGWPTDPRHRANINGD
jgi:5-methylcytosine-specific restriction protein A